MYIHYSFWGLAGILFFSFPLLAQDSSSFSEKTTSLNEVMVSSAILRNDASTNISVLSASQIKSAPSGSDIPFVLSGIPSVVAYSDGGTGMGYTGLRLRGSDLTRINVTINGVPYNDAESHAVYFVNIPNILSFSKDVTLQRGVGVSTQGTSAFGGSLSFNILPDFSNEWNVNASLGSFFSRTLSVKRAFSPSDKFALQTSFSYSGTDGYRDRSWAHLGSFSLSATYKPSLFYQTSFAVFLGKERLSLAWEGISQEQLQQNRTYNPLGYKTDGSTYDNETDNYAQAHFQWINSFRFSPLLSLHLTTYYSKGGGYYEEFKDDVNLSTGEFGIKGLVSQEESIVRRLHLDNDLLGQQLLLSWQAHPHHRLDYGLSGNVYWGNHFGKILYATKSPLVNYTYYDLDAQKYDIQSFVRWQWDAFDRKLFGYVDIQWRNVNYTLNGFRKNPNITHHVDYHFFNPKMGIGTSLKNQRLLFSFAVGQREPIREDFEAEQNLPSPEVVFDGELEHLWRWKFIRTTTTIYLMYYHNQLVNTGRINDVGAYTRENVAQSYRLGLEFAYQAIVAKGIDLSGNFNWSNNTIESYTQYIDTDNGTPQVKKQHYNTPLPFSPPLVNNIRLSYQALSSLRLSLIHQYIGKQYLDLAGSDALSLSAYQTLGFAIDYTFPTGNLGEVLLQAFVNNLTNEWYSHNGYGYSLMEGGVQKDYPSYFPAAGINFSISAKWTIRN